MCDKAVSKDLFMLKYCLDSYMTQEMWDQTVSDFLLALQFVPDWFVANKMLEKFNDALFADDDMNFINEGFNNVTFLGGEMGILSVDLDKINLSMLILMNMILKMSGHFETKNCMKTWYNSKIFMNLCGFSCVVFAPKCPDTPQLYTTNILWAN